MPCSSRVLTTFFRGNGSEHLRKQGEAMPIFHLSFFFPSHHAVSRRCLREGKDCEWRQYSTPDLAFKKKSGMEVTTGEAGGPLGAIEQLGFAGEVRQFRERKKKRTRFSNLKQMALLLAQRVGNS